MAYDWREELRKQREADDADRKRARESRERTTEMAKKLIKGGDVQAATALYGIEPGRRDESIPNAPDELEILKLGVQNKLSSFLVEHLGGDALSCAFCEVARAVDNRLDRIVVTAANADSELSRLRRDYEWMFDFFWRNIRDDFDILAKRVSARAYQDQMRVLNQLPTQRPSGGTWRIKKLPDEFSQSLREQLHREGNEKQKAEELHSKVNAARVEAGLFPW
jgi:hypothetical protein